MWDISEFQSIANIHKNNKLYLTITTHLVHGPVNMAINYFMTADLCKDMTPDSYIYHCKLHI